MAEQIMRDDVCVPWTLVACLNRKWRPIFAPDAPLDACPGIWRWVEIIQEQGDG